MIAHLACYAIRYNKWPKHKNLRDDSTITWCSLSLQTVRTFTQLIYHHTASNIWPRLWFTLVIKSVFMWVEYGVLKSPSVKKKRLVPSLGCLSVTVQSLTLVGCFHIHLLKVLTENLSLRRVTMSTMCYITVWSQSGSSIQLTQVWCAKLKPLVHIHWEWTFQ